MREITFAMPRAMSREEIAETFNAYLIGRLAYNNEKKDGNPRPNGPYMAYKDCDDSWQLDPSNDFWLKFFPNDTGRLSCRVEGDQEKVLDAIFEIFKYRIMGKPNRVERIDVV
ncbi:hypothetical protein HYT05_03270 [Candidatus Kaiserbacteria bacterium]|nr:hypothetical protein [Candidatus Kaiserbacteria bacterium]